jgi:ectoine hydroxylase-related dioxygenase (phytanoyl-CoA dioxygenase family)
VNSSREDRHAVAAGPTAMAALLGDPLPPLTWSLSPSQLEQFECDGAVTVESAFTAAELHAAEQGWDRLATAQRTAGATGGRQGYREMGVRAWPELAYDAATIAALQHPWFEAVAKQCLRTDHAVFFQQSNNLVLPSPLPHPDDQWTSGAHCDTQLTTSDWAATPRRTVLCFWLWLSDVPSPERGAMRYVAGSHLRTAAHWEAVTSSSSQSGRQSLPRIYGTDIRARPGRDHERTTFPANSDVGSWLRQQEPVPLLARRGQCTVMTTALLHSAWLNQDSEPRKGMHFAWTAAGVSVGLPAGQDEDGRIIYPGLRERLRPERRHIIPEVYPHFVSEGPVDETTTAAVAGARL